MTKTKLGFTLAEVLITLAIIGVVAAMTIPTLIANYQQRSWDTAASVFNRRLGEALKVMYCVRDNHSNKGRKQIDNRQKYLALPINVSGPFSCFSGRI